MQSAPVFMRCRHAAGMDTVPADYLLDRACLVVACESDVEVVVGYDLDGRWYLADFRQRLARSMTELIWIKQAWLKSSEKMSLPARR